MRSNIIPQAPKVGPLAWVLYNKAKVSLGGRVDFDRYIDYGDIRQSPTVARRSFLGAKMKANWAPDRATTDQRYPLRSFFNR